MTVRRETRIRGTETIRLSSAETANLYLVQPKQNSIVLLVLGSGKGLSHSATNGLDE